MNGSNIKLKYLTSNDIDKLIEFERQARLTEPEIWLDDYDEDNYRYKLKKANLDKMENNKIIIAMEKDNTVGRCDISIIISTVDFEKTGYIDWIYTLKNNRGMGIGKKLFSKAEEYFKENGVTGYYLFTAENEQDKEFYYRQKDFKFSKKEIAEKKFK
ncbi:GNAT family N-acetyltransferase [Dethiothermospora halolimnae]|uniref:GNAT family N-acetyltransferase n=1 Tax=Dethiothermospora halolimnae TaxID=3114390 RepID=UPI003CCB97ED